MTLLHLGVAEVPYVTAVPAGQRRVAVRTRRGAKPTAASHPPAGGETTADIARILEAKYHLFEVFFEVHKDEIAASLTEALRDAADAVMMGAPLAASPYAAGTSLIEARFKRFLYSQEVERLGIPGVPTRAALDGINHRFKNPRTGKRRPSFIDTGLFEASFKAWVT